MDLTADSILSAADTNITPIDLPSWGGSAYLKTMTGADRDSWDLYSEKEISKKGSVNIRAAFAVRVLSDKNGARLFTDEQAKVLAEKSGAMLDKIWDEGRKLNGLDPDAVETAEKNS